MYQSETYICWYLRVAMVAKMLTPNMIHATTTRTSSEQRQFGVLQALVPAGQQADHGAQDDDVPQGGGGHAQFLAPQLDAAQPRHDVVGQPHVGGQQPAEQHAVDVQRAQPSVRQIRHRAEQFRPDELGGDGDGDDADDEEVRDGADQEPLRRRIGMDDGGGRRRGTPRSPRG